jgi:hypothetical protein
MHALFEAKKEANPTQRRSDSQSKMRKNANDRHTIVIRHSNLECLVLSPLSSLSIHVDHAFL